MARRGTLVRDPALLLALCLASLPAGHAAAQSWDGTQSEAVEAPPRVERDTPQRWGPAVLPAPVDVDPGEPVPTHHVLRTGVLVPGVVMLVVGYAASAIWGGHYIGDIPLGVVGCNDTYAGWHFLPVIGPIVGMGLGSQCSPTGVHFEEALLPVLFTLVQSVGLALTIVGAIGRDVPDAPRFSLSADPSGARAGVTWSF